MSKNYRTDNKSFMVYKDWEEYIELLDSDEDAGRLFKALFAYAKRGEQPDFTGALKMAFAMMSKFIDLDGHKWEETCAQRSKSAKKREANKRAQKAQPCTKTTETTDKDTETDKEKDTDTVTVKETEKESKSAKQTAPSKSYQIYGEYGKVKLTDSDYSQLSDDYSEAVLTDYIRRVDEYCQQKGKSYNDCALTIRKWIDADSKQPAPTKDKPSYDLDEWANDAMALDPFSYTP